MRLIDADAIPYTMLYKENWLAGTGCEEQGAWKSDIDAMPTIEERKKGEWMERNSKVKGLGDVYICPFCRYEVDCVKENFCPNCGAVLK